VVVVDVEAGELDEGHPRVDDRVRLAGQDLDGVAEVDERLGQVAGVDALPTDVRLPPVREVRDAQGIIRSGNGASAARGSHVAAWPHSRLASRPEGRLVNSAPGCSTASVSVRDTSHAGGVG